MRTRHLVAAPRHPIAAWFLVIVASTVPGLAGQDEVPDPPPLAPSVERFGERSATYDPPPPFEDRRFTLDSGDVAVFVGQTDTVRSRQDGTLEARLAAGFRDARPRFRHMAWEGDTVFEQWRDLEFGTWADQLRAVRATVIIASFGAAEILEEWRRRRIGLAEDDADAEVERFVAAYETLLDHWETVTRRIVLIGPRPFETPRSAHVPDHRAENERVALYSAAIDALAERRGHVFVDLAREAPGAEGLTTNGIHLTKTGQTIVGEAIAEQLLRRNAAGFTPPGLLAAIREKNRLWFDAWRPMNWSFAFGDRTTQPFGTAGGGRPALRIELEELRPLIGAADRRIHDIALGLVPPPESTTLAVAAESRDDGVDHSPEAELASFRLLDGFEASLFASEADGVVKPLQMRWDDRGRLWVICAPTYPHIEPGAAPRDYVLVCEDTDGDGRGDRFHRFAEGLFIPMGLEFAPDGIWLCEGTELVRLRDTDEDGRADEREVVLSGFGTADSHQMVSSAGFGPGGELWFAQGHHVYSRVETPWGIERLEKSGLWRYKPRTGRLHGFFNQSSAGLNCQGVTYDSQGRIFHNSAAWSGGFYTVPGMIPTLRPRRYMALAVPDRRNTGIEFLDTEHVPPGLRGCVAWGGFMSNSIQLHRFVEDGSGFTAEVLPDLLSSSRIEFRPVAVRVGPDGAIYVCDWYNAIIGHYQASYRDPRRDRSRGRIWRIAARDRPLVTQPRLEDASPAELLRHAMSAEGLLRQNARRRLFDLPTDVAIAAADTWLASSDPMAADHGLALLAGMSVYEAHEVVRPDVLTLLLGSDDAPVRAYGARVVGHWADRLVEPLGLLRPLVTDPDSGVRLEAVVAASHIPASEAVEVATLALSRPRDRYLDYALAQCVAALEPHWYPALLRGEVRCGGDPERLRFLLESTERSDVGEFLRGLIEDAMTPRDTRERLLALLVAVGTPDDLRFAVDRAPESPLVLTELAAVAEIHGRRPTGDLAELLRRAWNAGTDEHRTLAARLSAAWGDDTLRDSLHAALDAESPASVVAAALEALAVIDGAAALDALRSRASADAPLAVRAAAIRGTARIDVDEAARLAAVLAAASRTEDGTRAVLSPLLDRQRGGAALAAAFAEVPLERDAAILAQRVISASGRHDPSLARVLLAAIGRDAAAEDFDPELVREIAAAAETRGDEERGRSVFLSSTAGCTSCHRLGDEGGDLGPDLTIIGAGRPIDALVESILWPNRQVREGYASITVVTASGEVAVGYRVDETETELRIRVAPTGETRRFAKAALQSVEDSGSIMPEGLAAGMTRDEVRDLVRFLSERRE